MVADEKIKRVVLCSGKVYYDLLEEREKNTTSGIYFLRLEQIYPFPDEEIIPFIKRFPSSEWLWCQEEPQNMGAWHFVAPRIQSLLDKHLHKKYAIYCISRLAAASPATGWMKRHLKEKARIMEHVFANNMDKKIKYR